MQTSSRREKALVFCRRFKVFLDLMTGAAKYRQRRTTTPRGKRTLGTRNRNAGATPLKPPSRSCPWRSYPTARLPGPVMIRKGCENLLVLVHGWAVRDACLS
jgi:hypothetical protein